MGRQSSGSSSVLQRTAGRLVRPGARVALRDDPAGARPRRGRQQVVGAPGPELVGGGERLVGLAEAPHARQRGHLVHDHLRRGGQHRRDHRLAIQPVEDYRLRARRAQLRDLTGRPRCGGDLVTRRDQPGNQMPSQCPGRSRDENSHDLSFRLVLSLEDVAAWSPCSFWLNVLYGRNALTMRSRRLPDIRHPADAGSASVTSRKQPGSSSRPPWSWGRSGSSTARRNGKTMPAEDASAFDVQRSRRQLRRADRSRVDDLVAGARR